MNAQELLKKLNQGEILESKSQVKGYRPSNPSCEEMICACDPDGECCGN